MTGNAAHIVILAGPNGAGKSTLAPALLRDTFGLRDYVNADMVAAGLSGFGSEDVGFTAGRFVLMWLRRLARQRESFAFESTLAARSYVRWIEPLMQRGYRLHIVFLWLNSPDLAVQRVRDRVAGGGHDIPERVIRRRYRRGIINFMELYRPLATTWAVYNNSQRPAALIATGTGSVTSEVREPELWRRFCEAAR